MSCLTRFVTIVILNISILPTATCLAENNFVGQMGAPSSCSLDPAPASDELARDELCSSNFVALGGEIGLKNGERLAAVSVDSDGIFSSEVAPGRYRVSLRKLTLDGKRLNPRLFRVAKRVVTIGSELEPHFFSIRHHTRKTTKTPGIGF